MFTLACGLLGFVAGGVASVAGFGIGSLMTPLFAARFGVKLAVALVSIPHFSATVLRAWRLRRHVDRHVLLNFGITSAAAGLLGALLHGYLQGRALGIVFGCLLLLAGISGMTGLANRVRLGRRAAWIAGFVSGAFGGLVGDRGGIRSAALLGADVPKESFVATATVVGVIVDVARVPVYVATEGQAIVRAWPFVAAATVGALVGTIVGERILRRVPERVFRVTVSILVLALGLAFLTGVAR